MSDIILEAVDLHKRFTQGGGLFAKTTTIHAVNGVSLQVRRGETFAIVGESGCGKSTLARLLLRLIDPTEGSVIHEGQDLTQLGAGAMRSLRSDLQFIFQDPFSALNPRMTVETIIGEPLRLHTGLDAGARRRRVAELMARVGLRPEMADRYPHEFSGGQRQRICIARALASGPKLVIGDEPVSALDVSVQAQVVNLLAELRRDMGLSMIFIAHDLSVVKHISDRIVVMYLGRFMESAAARKLCTRPEHPYTQALISSVPIPDPVKERARKRPVLEGELPSPLRPPSGCVFRTRCPKAQDSCARNLPAISDLGEGHLVACPFHAPAEVLAPA